MTAKIYFLFELFSISLELLISSDSSFSSNLSRREITSSGVLAFKSPFLKSGFIKSTESLDRVSKCSSFAPAGAAIINTILTGSPSSES